MKPQWIFLLGMLVTTASGAAEPAQKPAEGEATEARPAEKAAPGKEPGTMEKAGSKVKSGYHKTVKTLKKHGRKKPACSPAQKSLNQCK